jgi:hypothetical protein
MAPPVVGAVGERVRTTHEAARLVEQGKVELGQVQVQRPPGLPPVQLL